MPITRASTNTQYETQNKTKKDVYHDHDDDDDGVIDAM
jgi:hypothetical protein